jgi:hypothetical protein
LRYWRFLKQICTALCCQRFRAVFIRDEGAAQFDKNQIGIEVSSGMQGLLLQDGVVNSGAPACSNASRTGPDVQVAPAQACAAFAAAGQFGSQSPGRRAA